MKAALVASPPIELAAPAGPALEAPLPLRRYAVYGKVRTPPMGDANSVAETTCVSRHYAVPQDVTALAIDAVGTEESALSASEARKKAPSAAHGMQPLGGDAGYRGRYGQ